MRGAPLPFYAEHSSDLEFGTSAVSASKSPAEHQVRHDGLSCLKDGVAAVLDVVALETAGRGRDPAVAVGQS